MSGYDDDTSETEIVKLVVKPEYWVEIKTCLERRDVGETEQALTRMSATLDGNTSLAPDVAGYRDLLVFRSIVGWNLTESDGNARAITMENVQKLKGPDFDAVLNRVQGLNQAKTPQEQAKIPGQS